MRRVSGFTLIEIMIVIAIIGVLSAIAFPAFKVYQEKTERTGNCKVHLVEIARELELYKSLNQTYPPVLSGNIPYDLDNGNYTIELKATSARTYTLICKRNNSAVDPGCGDLTYDNFGRKGAMDDAATPLETEACWR